jgi:hypothetical protein
MSGYLQDEDWKRVEAENEQGPDRDGALREIVGGRYRATSPRSAFERSNQYVPTRVRAAIVPI